MENLGLGGGRRGGGGESIYGKWTNKPHYTDG